MFFSPFPTIPRFADRKGRIRTVIGAARVDFDEDANFREKSFIISGFAEMPAVPAWRQGWCVFCAPAMAAAGGWEFVFGTIAGRKIETPSLD